MTLLLTVHVSLAIVLNKRITSGLPFLIRHNMDLHKYQQKRDYNASFKNNSVYSIGSYHTTDIEKRYIILQGASLLHLLTPCACAASITIDVMP